LYHGCAVIAVLIQIIGGVSARFENYLYSGTQPKSLSVFTCLREAGLTNLKLNVFLGSAQTCFTKNYEYATSAGYNLTEFWVSFHPRSEGNHPPPVPVAVIAKALQQVNARVSRIWITITDAYWYDDELANREYILGIVEAFGAAGLPVGIDTDYIKWRVIFGAAFTDTRLTSLPLMYENDDGNLSFDDWPENSFGGWKTPTAKEYAGYIGECGADLNGVWRPTSNLRGDGRHPDLE
jgi:hypothetical protein